MGVTLVSLELLVLLSHLWEKEKEEKNKEKGRKEKGIEKEWKEGRLEDGIKKDWRKEQGILRKIKAKK